MVKLKFFNKKAAILIIILAVVVAAAVIILHTISGRTSPEEKAAEAADTVESEKPVESAKPALKVYVDSCPIYMSLEDMADKADTVVHGRVTGRSDAFSFSPSPAMSPTAYTDVYLEPISTLKGEAEQEPLPIRTEGGTLDGVEYICNSEPKLTDGEEYVLFLRKAQEDSGGDAYYFVCGIDQGAFKKSGESFTARGGGSYTLDEFTAML